MADKKYKFNLDYKEENYKKINIQPTQAIDFDEVINDDLYNEYATFNNDELNYKLENEKLSKEAIEVIKKILSSRK